MDLGLYAVKNVVSTGAYDDFQLQMQHLAFGGMEIEPGCAVLKIPFKCPAFQFRWTITNFAID